jgi:hypothetical protein
VSYVYSYEPDPYEDPDPGDELGPPDVVVQPAPQTRPPVPLTASIAGWLDHLEARINKNDDLHVMPYSEYLRSPEWAEVRRVAVRRAGHQCQRCGAKGGELNVHHHTYERRGYEDLWDLIVLCRACHRAEHGIEEGH